MLAPRINNYLIKTELRIQWLLTQGQLQLGGRQSHGSTADGENCGDLRYGLDHAESLLQTSAIVDEACEFGGHWR